jgi:hypothetical protein
MFTLMLSLPGFASHSVEGFASLTETQEIVTGRVPFSQYKHDGAVLAAVTFRDERPQRLIEDVTPERLLMLWGRCWDSNPERRPCIQKVCESLKELSHVNL